MLREVTRFIEDGINGYMVPQKNVDALVDRIVRLLDMPDCQHRFCRLSAKSRDLAIKSNSFKKRLATV